MKSNTHRVFEYLLKHPRSSGSEIAKALDLKHPAVGVALKRLRVKGAVDKLDIRVGNTWRWVVTADAAPDFRAKILSQRPQGWGKTYHRKPEDVCKGDGGKTLAQLLGYGG